MPTQESVSKAFSFSRGQELPTLTPNTEKKEHKMTSEDDAQEKSLTDAELLKKDAVKVGITEKKEGFMLPL